MVILINKNISDNIDTEKCTAIKYLLCIAIYHNRYQLLVNSALSEQIERKIGRSDAELLKQAYVKSINIRSHDCEISNAGKSHDDEPIFTIEEGIRYLLQPVSIVLENSKNDGYFISEMVRVYNNEKLAKALDEQWVCYVNAGGCSNFRNVLEVMLSQHNGRKKFLRCYVILDSDKHAKNHIVPKTQKYEKELNEMGVPYHIWEKRMMENYVPDGALKDSSWKDAYVHLSDEQKDFYYFSGGFEKDEKYEEEGFVRIPNSVGRKALLPCEEELYSSVSEVNYQKLRCGMPAYSKELFPKLFKDPSVVNKTSMRSRLSVDGGLNEVELVLENLSKLL